MAQPSTATFGKFILLVGNGGSPEVFAAPCGFTERSLELKSDTNSTQVPDCDNPDAPAWEDKDVRTLSASVTGQGVMALEALPVWRDWYFTAAEKNVRVQLALPAGKGPGFYQGAAILTSLKHDSNIGEKCKLSVSIENTGAWAWFSSGSGGGTPSVISIGGSPAGSATVGAAYSFVPTTANGSGSKVFTLTGTLPASLSFSTTTGGITGTPTATGTASGLSIGVTDASGSATLGPFSIEVVSASTSAPGGGANNNATFADLNNAYLVALAA